jgi:REP-associated tyrosine transposase
MPMNEKKEFRRRPLRLAGFDYSQPSNYFVTICAQGHNCIFGYVSGTEMRLNSAGAAVQEAWFGLPARFPSVALRELVVMPNHLHAIVGLTRTTQPLKAGAASGAPTRESRGPSYPALGDVIRAFKSISAIQINGILGRRGKAVWQRNYYEHIIHNIEEYQRIRKYILENPGHWHDDPENPGL